MVDTGHTNDFKGFDLTGKTALVTGSSQGIGLAIAEGLGEAGARIVINGRDTKKLDAAHADLDSEGHSCRRGGI